MALAGHLATVFASASHAKRGKYAVITLALSVIIIMTGISIWMVR